MSQSTNPDQPVYLDPARPFTERVKDLIAHLTLQEKVEAGRNLYIYDSNE